jgi:endogenous inhibitor of DNA gyrase (YacG/DUF329 family)
LSGGGENVTTLRPRKPCPICGKQSVQGFHPFCSSRCADVDLNRWLSGRYAIATSETPAQSDEEPED